MDTLFDPADDSTTASVTRFTADPELAQVAATLRGFGDLVEILGICIRTALDEIIDTARTGRWDLAQCGDQEKAYLGVKVENVIRGRFELAPARRKEPDYQIAGIDVDCKWTKNMWQWSIPTEAEGVICLLVHADDSASTFCAGLLRINSDLLNPGANKDQKRTIRKDSRRQIEWLCHPGSPLPENFLLHMRTEDRKAILAHRGGDARLRELFRRHRGVLIKRHTIESLSQQVDATRRARATREVLGPEGLEVLNGHWKADKLRSLELGGPVLHDSTDWVCLPTGGTAATEDRM